MELLSLQGIPPSPVSRPTRAEAAMVSLVAHLLLFLCLIYAPDRLPDGIRRLLQGNTTGAKQPSAILAPTPVAATPEASKSAPEPRKPEHKIPLKFAYVRVPDDPAAVKNPDARLLSDKDRRARQEVPTPPDARQFSLDPHAEGNSRDRIRTDPTRPEGPDALDPVPTAPASRRAGGNPGKATTQAPGPEGRANPVSEPRTTPATEGIGALAPEPPPEEGGRSAGRPHGSLPEDGSPLDENEGPAGDPSRRPPPDTRGGTEYKFSFNNPGWLRGQSFGTLSFDTQGFPWGEYARQLYVIIRNNWLARIPLAAREGIAGYTCQHFVIARAGDISDIEIVRTSPVPPFNKAAGDALRASSPLPPLPEEFPNAQEGVTFCFYYNMYPGEAD